MTTTVTIGYGDGRLLETSVPVELVVNGKVVATANPNGDGVLFFNYDLPPSTPAAVRLQAVESP